MPIWQDLVDHHGFAGKYASVRGFMARLRATAPPEARVVIVNPLGAEGQVDYGEGPMVRGDRESGKYKRVRLFVLTLGCCRKSLRLLAWKSSSRIWAELHERAFRQLGGVPLGRVGRPLTDHPRPHRRSIPPFAGFGHFGFPAMLIAEQQFRGRAGIARAP